jgi:hypothetical protein
MQSEIVAQFLHEVFLDAILYTVALMVSFTLVVSALTAIVKLFVRSS